MLARLARDGELRALDEVYAYLFGAARFADAFEAWGMLDYRCCAELVVARASVLRVGRARLSRLAARIRADDAARDTSARWSYVMERTWQSLFSKPLVLRSVAGFQERAPTLPISRCSCFSRSLKLLMLGLPSCSSTSLPPLMKS